MPSPFLCSLNIQFDAICSETHQANLHKLGITKIARFNANFESLKHSTRFHSSSSSIGTTTLSWVSACPTVVEPSQQEGFYRVPLQVARPTPNLEENQGLRAFQLSPQEAPSVWSDASEPSSGRWNYGREMAEKFCWMWRLPRHFWVLKHAVKHDMGQTALLPLRRKACWGFFRPKNPTVSAGFLPANLGTKGQHATSRPPKPLLIFITLCNSRKATVLKEINYVR
jgi:hypothetical protein